MPRSRIQPNTTWDPTRDHGPHFFRCGFCDREVAAIKGWQSSTAGCFVRICPGCHAPTFFDGERQTPGVAFGADVTNLPQDVGGLYAEARSCCSAQAYTAAVLALRKLLMHVAVGKGAPENQPFMKYVEFLSEKGYVPPDGKGWVDHIRRKGNEANHEITLMSAGDATDLIRFSEMLLKFIFEFPAAFTPRPPADGSA